LLWKRACGSLFVRAAERSAPDASPRSSSDRQDR
jgi:hypothetical protein